MEWQRQAVRVGSATLLLFAAVLFALHYVHLRADFPNHSPWMDWAKYTDEGWYGDAAIRYYLRGGWRVPGDFNPGAALPVWPLLEALVFRFTGVGVIAARALAGTVLGGTIADGIETVEQCGERIFEAILRVASGERTKSEQMGFGDDEFAPWQLGATV